MVITNLKGSKWVKNSKQNQGKFRGNKQQKIKIRRKIGWYQDFETIQSDVEWFVDNFVILSSTILVL